MFGLGSLEGRLRHCVRYKTGKKGRKVCGKYSAGPGNPRGRKKAGIKSKFYERSKTKKSAHKTCAKWGRKSAKTGRKRCMKWRYISATAIRRRHRKGKRSACLRWGKSSVGKKVCKKWSPSIIKKRAKARKGTRKGKTYGVKAVISKFKKTKAGKEYLKLLAAREAGMEGLFGFGSPRRRRRSKTRKTARRVVRRTRRRVARRRSR